MSDSASQLHHLSTVPWNIPGSGNFQLPLSLFPALPPSQNQSSRKGHPKFPFPFNIHDRSKYIEKLIKNKFQSDFDIIKEKKLKNNKIIGYDLIIKKNESNIDYEDLIKILKKHNYEYKIENDIMKIIIS